MVDQSIEQTQPFEFGCSTSELFVANNDLLEAADGMNRTMKYLWWNGPDEEMLVQDADSQNVYLIPPERVSWNFLSVTLNNESQIRVQWWDGEPMWVWGAA